MLNPLHMFYAISLQVIIVMSYLQVNVNKFKKSNLKSFSFPVDGTETWTRKNIHTCCGK